jgi:hypothetical protein
MKRSLVVYSKWPTNKSNTYGMKRSWVVYSKWPTNELHKHTCMRCRDRGLFIANGQQIKFTSMG